MILDGATAPAASNPGMRRPLCGKASCRIPFRRTCARSTDPPSKADDFSGTSDPRRTASSIAASLAERRIKLTGSLELRLRSRIVA